MKNYWKLGLVSLAAVGLFGAACTTDENTLNLSVKLEQGDIFQYAGTMYAYDNNTSRGIPTPEVFAACGFSYGGVKVIEQADFDQIPAGILVSATECPTK